MPLPLEDNYTDLIGKAMRGLKLTDVSVAEQTGLSLQELQTLHGGKFDANAAAKVAGVLGLDFTTLRALAEGRYAPAPIQMDGLAQFTTHYEDMTVNAYLVWDPSSRKAAVFDTGADVTDILAFAQKQELSIETIFITHTHGDHIFDLDRLVEKTRAKVWVGEKEPVDGAAPFTEGKCWPLGALQIESRSTWGHSIGGMTFVITGLARPVAIVGDSIFAGSMGGGGISYADAIKNNEEQILTFPPETILAPGHGPMTTVGEELRNNPFFAQRSAEVPV